MAQAAVQPSCNAMQFLGEQSDFCFHVVLTSAPDHAVRSFERDSERGRGRGGPSFSVGWLSLTDSTTATAFPLSALFRRNQNVTAVRDARTRPPRANRRTSRRSTSRGNLSSEVREPRQLVTYAGAGRVLTCYYTHFRCNIFQSSCSRSRSRARLFLQILVMGKHFARKFFRGGPT